MAVETHGIHVQSREAVWAAGIMLQTCVLPLCCQD